MAATLRQILANQQNAQKSTGPTTEEGKNASRRNALTHGLTATELLPDELDAAVQQRMIEWRPDYQLETPEQEWFFEQLVVNAVRLDHCQAREFLIRSNESQRAAVSWDEDRREQAVAIAAGLARRPEQVSTRLQGTRQGADWMIERWRTLGDIFQRNGEWTPSQISMALDLLGTPAELRDDFPIINDPAALVTREIERLERRKVQALNALDEQERAAAMLGHPLIISKAMKNLRGYESACRRDYHWAKTQLQAAYHPRNPYESLPAPVQNQTHCDSGQDEGESTSQSSDAGGDEPVSRPFSRFSEPVVLQNPPTFGIPARVPTLGGR